MASRRSWASLVSDAGDVGSSVSSGSARLLICLVFHTCLIRTEYRHPVNSVKPGKFEKPTDPTFGASPARGSRSR